MIEIDILICTHNRIALLQRAIRSILAADIPEEISLGIFVVANGCTDGTEDLLKRWQKDSSYFGQVSFRWKRVAELGKSVALNQSVREIRAPVVAFVDDDHRVHFDYLRAIYNAVIEYPKVELFCGCILPDWDAREPAWVHDQGAYRVFPLPVPRYDQGGERGPLAKNASTPGGGNLFMRTDLIERVGEFKTDLGPVGHNLGGAEDIEWVRRAIVLGADIHYIPEAVQFHYVDTQRLTIRYLMKKAYERTSSTIRVMADETPSEKPRIPIYTLRKSAVYAIKAMFCLTSSRRRHFLVRTAAALGEIDGFRQRGVVRKETADTNRGSQS